MSTVADMQAQVLRIWRQSFQYELNAALETHLRAGAVQGVQVTLEAALRAELDTHLGFARSARGPTGPKPATHQRSGYFTRRTLTSFGVIPALRVPKLRAGNGARVWGILTRY